MVRLDSYPTTGAAHDGIGRHWRIGNLTIEWHVERPPQAWIRVDGVLTVRWTTDE